MKRGMVAAGLVIGFILGIFSSYVFLVPKASVILSPDNGDEVISFIDHAQRTLEIEVYVFTSHEVLGALERAKARGVAVRVVIERNIGGNENDAMYSELASDGISVRYSSGYKLMHAKFIIADGKSALVGSHNFSDAALKYNREASVIILDREAIGELDRAFEKDWALAA